MVVVDTNVLVCLLIAGDRTPQARELFARDPDWHSDGFLLIELSNVLATTVRARGLSLAQAGEILTTATEILRGGSHAPTHTTTLELAFRFSVTAYDARFLAVAEETGVRLVTEDAGLRRAAPLLTQSIAEALAQA